MARKPNYNFEKRQKELSRKSKKEEKKQRKSEKEENLEDTGSSDDLEAPVDAEA